MKAQFSTVLPNQTKGKIKSLLEGINFFNNSPNHNGEVKDKPLNLQSLICNL